MKGLVRFLFHDTRYLYRYCKMLYHLGKLRRRNEPVGKVFDVLAKKKGEQPCFYFNENVWSYKNVQVQSNRVANYFAKNGFVKGDTVALFMTNRVELILIWLGLSKIGVVPALVNSNLVSDVLKHSIQVVKPKAIICGKELLNVVENAYGGQCHIPVYCTGRNPANTGLKSIDIDQALESCSAETPIPTAPVTYNDDLFYIYTSGTTGLPKAAIIKHARYFMASFAMSSIVGLKPDDIVYTCFPLQHTTAGIVATGFALHRGTPLVIRSKFSASEFWKDCAKYNVTVAQYIGEICRYLLRHPVTPEETHHKIRMMLGNGLRPEIWSQFQTRFKIPLISEFYGSTEGNCNMFNAFGYPGAFGYIPNYMKNRIPVILIRLDDDEQPIRNAETGLVEEAEADEPGELVGQMIQGDITREFKGYAGDSSQTTDKVLYNVRANGDKFFRSGDLCVKDATGYFYFKDRIGDSFRFKGENVSATQVEGVINKITHSHDAVVFGVKVPNVDGSVGMAVMADPSNSLDLDALADGLTLDLPEFAIPRFLRVPHSIGNTLTHKLKKSDFKKDGLDMEKIGQDNMYFFQNKKFEPLTPQILSKISSGEINI